MKNFLSLALVVIMAFTFVACGEKSTVSDAPDASTDAAVAETGTKKADYETVATGNKITTDSVEITITEAGMTNSLKTSIQTGNFTRTFGPDDSEETDFAFIKGKIMNKATKSIGKEIVAMANVGDYTLEEDGVYVYKADGDTVWELSPLVEYNFMMYVEIPNTLVESMESCNFNFGFSGDLTSSSSDFDELEYKYTLEITPESEQPVPETATAE